MATVPTSTGTYLSDLFNPQVIGDMINEKLIPNIVFAPLAVLDYTLQGRPGDEVTLPYFNYIGDATDVPEGTDIPISKLTEQTKKVKIHKIGKGVQLTDEAVLSGYGDPIGEVVRQISMAMASKVDTELLAALDANTQNVYTLSADFTPDDIPKALAKFGEDMEGPKAIIVNPDTYARILDGKSWLPASSVAADVILRGSVGMAYGVQIIVSERITDTMHIVKPGALAIYMKRDTFVETDRDIINKSTVITADKLFAPYLYKPSNAIKIVKSVSV